MRPHIVLLFHGIGDAKAGYGDPFKKNLLEVFEDEVKRISGQPPSQQPVIREVLWSSVTGSIQAKLWERMFPGMASDEEPPWWQPWARLRYFVVHYLGDTVAYDEPPGKSKYGPIHRVAWNVMDRLAIPSSLTIVGHSFGAVIASDLVADAVDSGRPGHIKAWPAGLKLTNLFTMGSPLSLYAVQFDELEELQPIKLQDQEHGLWINIYDSQDVLGFPLKKVNAEFDQAVFADKAINAGSWWNPMSATPLSHEFYWDDSGAAEIVGRKVALDWLRENHPDREPHLRQEYADYRSWIQNE
jgi:hypothetical protein